MVTSTKSADDKVVGGMGGCGGGGEGEGVEAEAGGAEGGGGGEPAPPRTLLEQVNAHLTCVLCAGYYIDATTIVECLHSFCRSCIVKHLQAHTRGSPVYCPVCDMMINAARPNLKPDKALQDIVYKLVPGLFQREMERRRRFYSSRPGPAASATPEQRGEDTERIIFSPEDVISFSLEYVEATDADSVSSRSSESGGEAPACGPTARRYLQCPAVVNVGHLKKFLSVKFDIDCSKFCIDVLYKRVELADYYTLMDIAYIFNWKRNEPMRFYYQITDYAAMRNRFGLFDMGRKGSRFRDRKPSPAPTDDTNASSPALPFNDPSSEGTSGTNSPMPDDSSNFMSTKNTQEKSIKKYEKTLFQSRLNAGSEDSSNACSDRDESSSSLAQPSGELDVEKSQFLNSFELTAKNSVGSQSSSPNKTSTEVGVARGTEKSPVKSPKLSMGSPQKTEDTPLKRKTLVPDVSAESKKQKTEKESSSTQNTASVSGLKSPMKPQLSFNTKEPLISKADDKKTTNPHSMISNTLNSYQSQKPLQEVQKPASAPESTHSDVPKIAIKPQDQSDNSLKRSLPTNQKAESPKRKSSNETIPISQPQVNSSNIHQKSVPVSKTDTNQTPGKNSDQAKPNMKKLPELKLTIPNPANPSKPKPQQPPPMHRGIRTDLLANNSDPITDRRKFMAQQIKSSLGAQSPSQVSGDPLKSLFDSCKINIPSSLSITLTDQKLDPRGDVNGSDPKKSTNSLNGSGNFNPMKTPTPPVQNSIEILKLPDLDPTKPVRPESTSQPKPTPPNKPETSTPSSTKGPMPSLKPISDTKLGKSSNFNKPTTFQQTFLQSLQQTDKPKFQKAKPQVPKLMPANPNVKLPSSEQNEPNVINQPKPPVPENNIISSTKSDSVLDLSTAHNAQSQSGPQQTKKALETMQTIANLAKKQNLPPKTNASQSFPHNSNKTTANIPSPLRMPVQNQNKLKISNPLLGSSGTGPRNDQMQSSKPAMFRPTGNPNSNPGIFINQISQQPVSTSQPSPRQTRSPSTSPKLVIAEEKQTPSGSVDSNINQSNQMSSSHLSSPITPKTALPGPRPPALPSKQLNPKGAKPTPISKLSNVRFPGTSNKPNPSVPSVPGPEMSHLLAQQAFMRQQYDIQSQMGLHLPTPAQWLSKINQARQIENFMKSLSNAHQAQSDYASKDTDSK